MTVPHYHPASLGEPAAPFRRTGAIRRPQRLQPVGAAHAAGVPESAGWRSLELVTGRVVKPGELLAPHGEGAIRMPALLSPLGQNADQFAGAAEYVRDRAAEAEEAVNQALGRALVTLAAEGPLACADRTGMWAAGAGADAAGWLAALPGSRVVDLLPLPAVLRVVMPQQTVAALVASVPWLADEAADAVRSAAASVEEVVHDALGRTLTVLSREGPAAGVREAGASLAEVSRWAGNRVLSLPGAAQQALISAVPLPHWCTRLILRWAASLITARIYAAAGRAEHAVSAGADVLAGESLRALETVDQALRRFGADDEAAADAAPPLTAQQRRQLELRAFKATLLGLGADEVQALVTSLKASAESADAERLAIAREFQTMQRIAVAGGPEAYVHELDPGRRKLMERLEILWAKKEKATPSRILPHVILPGHYRDKHLREKAERCAARARLQDIIEELEVIGSVADRVDEIAALSPLQHVLGPDATGIGWLRQGELDACEALIRAAIAEADGYADTGRLGVLLDRLRREPDARSMLMVVRTRGIEVLHARKQNADELVAEFLLQQSEREPQGLRSWLEWAGVIAPDPVRVAEYDKLTGLVAQARDLSAATEYRISLFQSPEYSKRVHNANSTKAYRDWIKRYEQEHGELPPGLPEEAFNTASLMKMADILSESVEQQPPVVPGPPPVAGKASAAERLI